MASHLWSVAPQTMDVNNGLELIGYLETPENIICNFEIWEQWS